VKRSTFVFEIVEFIPKVLEEGVLYVSMTYATASHRCFCGCGKKVVTPLSPTDWQLTFDGDTVSLDPSIGNWSYPCRSHYILHNNRVRWAGSMSDREIRAGRARDVMDKRRYYGKAHRDQAISSIELPKVQVQALSPNTTEGGKSVWMRVRGWWSR